MQRTYAILAAVVLMLVAASAVYAGGPVACGDGTVTWSPDTLWPPDRTLQTITISYTQPCDDSSVPPDGCAGGDFSVTVDDITSNEEPPEQDCGQPTPPQGLDVTGVGNSSGPVRGIEPITVVTTVQVRAERCGNGNGRIYTIDVTCEEHGETGTATLTVTVPHDLGH